MREIWMRPNTRVLWFSIGLASLVLVLGVLLWCVAPEAGAGWLVRCVGFLLAFVAIGAVVFLSRRLRTPRVAYDNGFLVVNLGAGQPSAVPIEIVECFFLGQGPSLLPEAPSKQAGSTEAATVVVRLAERAGDWKHREVSPALGLWCDGYITIRGTWTEPIDEELILRLNRQLVQVHRQRKEPQGRL